MVFNGGKWVLSRICYRRNDRSSVSRSALFLLLCLLLGNDLGDDSLDARLRYLLTDVTSLDNAQLNVLLGLDDLEESLDGEPHRRLLVHAIGVLVLQELTELLRLLPDRRSFPLSDGAGWLSLEELRLSIVEASDEGGDAEGARPTTLSVLLLGLAAEASDELNRGLVLVLEAEALALKAQLVDKDASIGLQSRES